MPTVLPTAVANAHAVPATTVPPAKAHFYWIDWMRFLAAMFVLLDHACQFNWAGLVTAVAPTHPTLRKFLVSPIHLGRQAVIVFFVLSGALVGGLMLEKFRAGTFDLRTYAADRITRLYVPLLPALLLMVAVMRVFEYEFDPWQVAGCLVGLQGVATGIPAIDSPLWSLAYEVWFYVLAGCVAVVAARRRYPIAGRVAALAVAALSLWILCLRLDWINLACWLVGAGGFAWRHRLARVSGVWLAATGIVLMLAGTLGLRDDLLVRMPPLAVVTGWPWVHPLAHLVLAVGAVLFVVAVCRSAPRTRAGARLERAGTTLAAFSYTLYLTHFPVVVALVWSVGTLPEVCTADSLYRLGVWMACCVAVAVVMYALFERQTARARRWLRVRLGGGTGRTERAAAVGLPLAVEA